MAGAESDKSQNWPFEQKKVFLPVIHPNLGKEAVYENISIVDEVKADGAFLINQGMGVEELLETAKEIRRRYPIMWIGINILGERPEQVVPIAAREGFDGIWADDCGVDNLDESWKKAADRFLEAKAKYGFTGLYFGGTAFKTQEDIPYSKLPEVAQRAATFVDIVTTSGRGTGIEADPLKVKIFREALGDHRLGLASGVTPRNVGVYRPFTDAFLVATGIEKRVGILDELQTLYLKMGVQNPTDD